MAGSKLKSQKGEGGRKKERGARRQRVRVSWDSQVGERKKGVGIWIHATGCVPRIERRGKGS